MAKKKPKTEEIVGNLDPKHWVQKSDPLVLMRSVPFTLGELKILDTYISRINASDDTRRTVIFTKEEYEELMGITCANYRALQKHTKGMLGKVVELQMPNKDYLQFVLFTKAYYHKDEYGKPIIEISCTEEAKDLFFCIDKYHYFKYALENVINLTHKASYLLYLYIRQNRYRGEWDIDLDELRDSVLDCKEQQTYKEFKEFKKAVLVPAVKEVNNKTDCHFDYEAIKRGRKVAKIKFIYHAQEQLEGQITFDQLMQVAEPDNEDKIRQKYESDDYYEYAESCNFEFNNAEIKVIFEILTRTDIEKDHLTDSLMFGRAAYLKAMYDKYRLALARNEAKGKPIKDHFAYFKKMLEKETYINKKGQLRESDNNGD